MRQQKVILFQSHTTGVFSTAREDNLGEINALLAEGWHVAMISPTSSPAVGAGAETRLFALVVLEKEE